MEVEVDFTVHVKIGTSCCINMAPLVKWSQGQGTIKSGRSVPSRMHTENGCSMYEADHAMRVSVLYFTNMQAGEYNVTSQTIKYKIQNNLLVLGFRYSVLR